MTQQFENFVNAALDKSLSSDVTLPTADDIPVFTGIGRQVTGKTIAELGLALTADLDTDGTLADNSDTKYPSQKAVKTYADTKQAKDATLTALAAFNTNGSLHQTAADTFVARTLTAGTGISITDGDGVAGNPTISLPASGVTAASYGSSTLVPVLTVNAQGVVTAASTAAIVAPTAFSDSAFRVQDNGNATKQLAFEVSGIATGTTRTITMPDADVNLGKVPATLTYSASGTLTLTNADTTTTNLDLKIGTIAIPASSTNLQLFTNSTYYLPSNSYTGALNLTLPVSPSIGTFVEISDPAFGLSTPGISALNIVTSGGDTIYGIPGSTSFNCTPFLAPGSTIRFTYVAVNNWSMCINQGEIHKGAFTLQNIGGHVTTISNSSVTTSDRTITIPDANVDLGKVLSNISYAPTTGVITLTNVDASTFATTNIGAIADDMLRIQATGAATKKMGFNCSAVAAGQTRIVTMPNADVDLGNLPQSYATTSLRTGTQAAPASSGAATTAYGYRAGFATTTGSVNTFVGTNAGLAVTTASGGVFVGNDAGSTVTTGTGNTIVGSSAASSLATTANSIVAIGASAGTKVGSGSIAIGSSANTNSTGTGTISIGDASGIHPLVTTSTSSNWVAIGSQAGQSQTASSVGGGWVAIGNLTGANNTSGDWVAIGNGAGAKANTDGSTSWVAIGVNANKNNFNDYGIAIGANAGYGSVANNRGTADSNNIFIGQSASRDSSVASGTAISDSLAIGRSATVAASNSFVLGSSVVPIKVGINMTTPTARLHLPAGSTSASSAPLKFTTGTNQTTAEAGTVEYNNAFFATPSDATRRPIKLDNSAVAPSNITVTASPFTYQNTTGYEADVIISGGILTIIEFTRDNATFYTAGFLAGVLKLSPNDRVRVTYTVVPTMTLVPR